MVAGDLQKALDSNLSDDLLSEQFVVQIVDPIADEVYFMLGFSRRHLELVDVYVRVLEGGSLRLLFTIADVAVSVSGITTGADVNSAGDLLATDGDWVGYEFDDPDDNIVAIGDSVKMHIQEITTDSLTAGMTLLVDIDYKRRRNVPS